MPAFDLHRPQHPELMNVEDYVQQEWERVKTILKLNPGVLPQSQETEINFKRAFLIAVTRAYRMKLPKNQQGHGESQLLLVPYFDFFNHQFGSAYYFDSQSSTPVPKAATGLTLRAEQQYSAGDQVFQDYGVYSNGVLLTFWGLAEDHNPVDAVSVTATHQDLVHFLDEHSTSHSMMLHKEKLLNSVNDHIQEFAQGFLAFAHVIPFEMLQASYNIIKAGMHTPNCHTDPHHGSLKLEHFATQLIAHILELNLHQVQLKGIDSSGLHQSSTAIPFWDRMLLVLHRSKVEVLTSLLLAAQHRSNCISVALNTNHAPRSCAPLLESLAMHNICKLQDGFRHLWIWGRMFGQQHEQLRLGFRWPKLVSQLGVACNWTFSEGTNCHKWQRILNSQIANKYVKQLANACDGYVVVAPQSGAADEVCQRQGDFNVHQEVMLSFMHWHDKNKTWYDAYKVEAIISEARSSPNWYLVKWEGRPYSLNDWEHEMHVIGTKALATWTSLQNHGQPNSGVNSWAPSGL